MKHKIFPRAVAYAGCAIFALTTAALAQNVEVRHDSKDSKTPPITQQPAEQWWSLTMETGYSSKYMFRGTNLTPNSDGIATQEVRFSAHGFTLGVWGAHQIGDAIVPHNTAVGESGGGGIVRGDVVPGVRFDDTAIQSRFNELDVYFSYYHSFGWIDLTVGNIAFFVDRSQVDHFEIFVFDELVFAQDFPSIENETFDRLFVALSTHKLPCNIVPTLTYYQTVYNDGNNPGQDILYFDRNDALGGYLEAKISASIPLVKDHLSLEPTALVSYSFDDRMEATNSGTGVFSIPTALPLTGFNHFQAGAELVWHLNDHVSLIGFGNYAHHFAAPTGGTDENTGWGGGRVSISF